MNPIQKIVEMVAAHNEKVRMTRIARQSSTRLGIRRTRAQMRSLKKWN